MGSRPIEGGSVTSTEISGLEPGTAYTFHVYTVTGGKTSIGYVGTSATTAEISVSMSASDVGWRGVTVLWTAAAGASGYEIAWYVGSTRIGSNPVDGGSVTSAVIDGLQPETAYMFRVYTVAGGKTSAGYVETSATTAAIPAPAPVTAVPDGLQSVTATWTPVSGVSGYRVELYIGSTLVDSKTPTSSETSATFSGLQPGADYTVRVYATYGDKASPPAEAPVTTPAIPAPESASVPTIGWQGVALSWAAVAEATGYKVEWWIGGTRVDSQIVSGGSVLSTEITGLQPETVYTFRVYTMVGEYVSTTYASTTETTSAIPAPAEASVSERLPRNRKKRLFCWRFCIKTVSQRPQKRT